MATDIAFAVGALALLGRKAPLSLRVFVLALAIADDLGAIIVIALFYSGSLFLPALAWMAGLVLAWLGARRLGIRSGPVYVVLGIAIWLAMLESGLHATLAGVLVAILVPSRPRYSAEDLDASLATVLRARSSGEAIAPEYQVGGDVLRALERLVRDTESPLERLERALHGWVSFVVLPLFAYANAGVALSGSALGDAWHSEVSWGIVLGLVVGKPLGIVLATGVALRLRLGELPEGIALVHVIGAGILAGVGFTVSLFVTELAFGGAPLGNEARVGVLCASLVAGVVGFVWLWIAPGEPDVPIDDHPAAVTH